MSKFVLINNLIETLDFLNFRDYAIQLFGMSEIWARRQIKRDKLKEASRTVKSFSLV